jgi:8-oxo-dGTP pyrophosphatase MutT (NUDIX family)
LAIRKLPFLSISFGPDVHLVEAISFGIKPALVEALDLTGADLEALMVNERTAPTLSGQQLPDISDTILQTIRECSFVICDTTGNRPNCYLELGYALGYGKKVIILHNQNQEAPAFNIRGRPIIFYRGYGELKEKLVAAIKDAYLDLEHDPVQDIEDFFQRCGLPIVPLEGDGRYDYRISSAIGPPIMIDAPSQRLFVPSPPWTERFQPVLSAQLNKAKEKGLVLYNSNLIRVRDYIPVRDEETRTRYIRLEVELTDYYTFVSSNYAGEFLPAEQAEELWDAERKNFRNLRKSPLANPLTMNVAVIALHLGREWILIQERNVTKTFHASRSFHASCAGMVSPSRDRRAAGIDVFATAKNELMEELGLSVQDDALSVLALVRETEFGELGFVAEVSVDGDPNLLLRPAADSFETTRVLLCELTPRTVAEFIKEHGGPEAFSALGLATIVFSLLKRFPPNQIESALRSTLPHGS